MAAAAAAAGLDPDRLSFIGCLRILRLRLPECTSPRRTDWGRWYQELLWERGQERWPARQNRLHPRVVKRKMSKFQKKRAPAPRTTAQESVRRNDRRRIVIET